jgi:hypothetical protein
MSDMTLTLRGAEIAKDSALGRRAAPLVRRELTVAPVCLSGFPKKFKAYLDLPDRFVVPLHWGLGLLAPDRLGAFAVADRRPPGEPWPPGLRFAGELRAELRQPEAVAAVEERWNDVHGGAQPGGALLCLPVGFGKTVTALCLMARVRRKTLVLVHMANLADQWRERAGQYLPGVRVTEIRGPSFDTSGDIVVATIQTLLSRKYPASAFACFGMVCVDESHHLAARAFSQCMWGLCLRRTLALTATPDRADGLTRLLDWLAGPTALRLRREHQASTAVRVVTWSCPEFAEPPPVNRRGDVCFTSVVTRLTEMPARTAVVAAEAAALARDGRDVLVLSHRRQHCADLAAAITALGAPAATYLGGDKAVPETRVIVSTYALTSEGFDLPRLTALVLATPVSKVEQSCGRVMRGSSASGAVIVDIRDAWGVCFSQHAKRRGFYTRSGFTISAGPGSGPDSGVAGVGEHPTNDEGFGFVDDD